MRIVPASSLRPSRRFATFRLSKARRPGAPRWQASTKSGGAIRDGRRGRPRAHRSDRAPTYGDGPISRWCKRALYEPRDEVFVRLTLKVIAIMSPVMVGLFVALHGALRPVAWADRGVPRAVGLVLGAGHPDAPQHDAPAVHPEAEVARPGAPVPDVVLLRHPDGLRGAPRRHAPRRGQHAARTCRRRCATSATASSTSSSTSGASSSSSSSSCRSTCSASAGGRWRGARSSARSRT